MEYQHGGDIYTNSVNLDYSANINPYGLPKKVGAAICLAVEDSSRYPDSQSSALRKKLSGFHGVSEETIVCGNGAADLIFQVVSAIRPKQALLISPSFLEYEQALHTVSCNITYYDLKKETGFLLNMHELISWIEESKIKFDMIFLCNPNNPTGFAILKEEMEVFLDYCKSKQIFCVMDECFNEFLDEPHRYSVLESMIRMEFHSVFLLKAFTKIYAMAGIRLGYGICYDWKLLDKIHSLRQPWSVSSLAQAAGEAALSETEYVENTRKLISCEREFLKSQLSSLGFRVYNSMANYIFFQDTRKEAIGKDKLLYEQMLSKKVLIRSCGNYRGLDGTYYRICVKQRKENEEFLSILKTILEKGE